MKYYLHHEENDNHLTIDRDIDINTFLYKRIPLTWSSSGKIQNYIDFEN